MKIRLFSVVHFKNLAKSLARLVVGIGLAAAQEATARMLGFRNLHEALLFHEDPDQLPSPRDNALSEPEREERQAELAQRLAVALAIPPAKAQELVATLSPLSTRPTLVAAQEDPETIPDLGSLLSQFRSLEDCRPHSARLLSAAFLNLEGGYTLDPSDLYPFHSDNLIEDWQPDNPQPQALAERIYAAPLYPPLWFSGLWVIAGEHDSPQAQTLRQELIRVAIRQLRRAITYAGRCGMADCRSGAIHVASLVIAQAGLHGWWDLVDAMAIEMASAVQRLNGAGFGLYDRDTSAVEGFRMWRVVAAVHLGNIQAARKMTASVVRRGRVSSELVAMNLIVQLDPLAPDVTAIQNVLADDQASGHILEMLATGMDDPLLDPIDVESLLFFLCDSAVSLASIQYLALVTGVEAWMEGFETQMRGPVIPVHRRLTGK